MKTNLVKILALGGIVFSLAACNPNGNNVPPEEPTERTLAEIFSIADGKYECEGELVKVESQCVYGWFGNTYVIGAPYVEGGDIRNLKGFEAELKEVPNWQGETKGRYANVNVIGRVADVNGRPVLQDAEIEINAEARYDENGERIDDDGAYSAGYWGTSLFTRGYYDEYMGKNMSGTLMEAYFQLASVPEEVSASAGSEFYVAFPGENLDLEDLDNNSLIYVSIPAGLNEAAVSAINSFFGEAQVGDVVDLMGITRWDTSKGGMGILMENWWSKYVADASDEVYIYSTWGEMAADLQALYNNPIVDLSAADENDNLGKAFSFVLDVDDYAKNPRDLWADAYKDVLVTVTHPEDCGTSKITANFKADDFADYITAVEEKLVDLGFDENDQWNSQGFITFSYAELGGDVVEELLVMASSETSLEIYYTAPRIRTDADFTDFASAKAAYEAEASALLSSAFGTPMTVTSALPAFPVPSAVANINFSWASEASFFKYYAQLGLICEFDFTVTLADGVNAQNAAAAYIQALETAGFVQGTYQYFSGTWFLNSTSLEMVNLGLTQSGELVLTVMYLNAKSAGWFTAASSGEGE